MRITHAVTSVSWIPSEAVTGAAFKQPFEIGLAHYDAPPPDAIEDLEAFIAAERESLAAAFPEGVVVEPFQTLLVVARPAC